MAAPIDKKRTVAAAKVKERIRERVNEEAISGVFIFAMPCGVSG